MPLDVVLRRALLITLLVVPQAYWLRRSWRLSAETTRIQRQGLRTVALAAVAAMVAVFSDAIGARFVPTYVSGWIAAPIQLWFFSSTFAFYLTQLLLAIAWCFTRFAGFRLNGASIPGHDDSRRKMLRQTAAVIGGAPFAGGLYGYAYERFQFAVERVDVRLANLPPALDGMRIVQLSDIHAGDLMPIAEIRRAVGITNSLDPHLTVITGDFLTRSGDPLAECIRELGRLHAPLGTWGCNGNHEIYAEAEADAEALFSSNGMRLLRGAAAQIEWNGAKLNLFGIDYQRNLPTDGSMMPALNGAENLVRRDMPNILLSHNPDTFPSAAAAGVELSLAGHTHGGQVNIALPHADINPARVLTRFIAGLYRLPLRGERVRQGLPLRKPRAGYAGLAGAYRCKTRDHTAHSSQRANPAKLKL